MSKCVIWNKIVLEEFISQALITGDDEKVLRMHVAGWSRIKIAGELGMSISTVDKTIARLKKQYDNVAKYDPILPPRRNNAKELFN